MLLLAPSMYAFPFLKYRDSLQGSFGSPVTDPETNNPASSTWGVFVLILLLLLCWGFFLGLVGWLVSFLR